MNAIVYVSGNYLLINAYALRFGRVAAFMLLRSMFDQNLIRIIPQASADPFVNGLATVSAPTLVMGVLEAKELVEFAMLKAKNRRTA